MRGSLASRESIDMISNIKKTKEYLQPTANSAYGLKQKQNLERVQEDEEEYDLEAYKNRSKSTSNLQNEMMMRPTVSPKDLEDVKRYETMQKMIKNKRNQ